MRKKAFNLYLLFLLSWFLHLTARVPALGAMRLDLILLVVITVLPYLTGMSGLFYLGGALVLGAGFLYYAIRLLNPPDEFFAMRVFNYSIVYLMALFAFLLVDHYLMPMAFQPGGLIFQKVG